MYAEIQLPARSPSASYSALACRQFSKLLNSSLNVPYVCARCCVRNPTSTTLPLPISATFNGNTDFAPSTSPAAVQTVAAAPTILNLTASPATLYQFQALSLAATIAAPLSTQAPNGSLTFYDSGKSVATAPLVVSSQTNTGSASMTLTSLAPGTHILTAGYASNANFLPSTSPGVNITVLPNAFSVTLNPSTLTIQTEHHATLTVTFTGIGLSDTVDIACGTLPEAASCNFNATTVQLQPGQTASVSLDIDTDAILDFANLSHPDSRPSTPVAFAALLPSSYSPAGAANTALPSRCCWPASPHSSSSDAATNTPTTPHPAPIPSP